MAGIPPSPYANLPYNVSPNAAQYQEFARNDPMTYAPRHEAPGRPKKQQVVHHHPPQEKIGDFGHPVTKGQTTLLCAYFPREATGADLEHAFAKVASVVKAVVMRETRVDGKSRCFGFVKLASVEGAVQCLRACARGEVKLLDSRKHVWHLNACWARSGDMRDDVPEQAAERVSGQEPEAPPEPRITPPLTQAQEMPTYVTVPWGMPQGQAHGNMLQPPMPQLGHSVSQGSISGGSVSGSQSIPMVGGMPQAVHIQAWGYAPVSWQQAPSPMPAQLSD